MRQSRTRRLVWAAATAILVLASPAGLKADAGKAKKLIVMIGAEFQDGSEFGAGIVIGSAADRLYIATANHVLRRGRKLPQEVRVRFKFLPGQEIEAEVLSDFDPDLDLAVLVVKGVRALAIPLEEIPFKLVGAAVDLNRGDEVFTIGNPQGVRWQVYVSPDLIAENIGDKLKFESQRVAKGHSGGGLFDKDWNLVGMITADQPPNGVALRIDRVLEQLKRWDYPVQLVRLKPEPPPPPPDAITVEEMDEIYYAVKMANVRSGPGSTFNKVARLSVGDEVEVTGKVKEKEWLRIALKDGKKAFVYAPLLSPEKPESIEPEVTPPVEPWSDPNPGPIPPAMVSVPDVVGLPQAVAISRLKEAQLTVGKISYLTLGKLKPGIVYGQKTAPGARLSPGAAVGLYIEREKLRGIQSSGLTYLPPNEVKDLDGDRSSNRSSHDIYFTSQDGVRRYLSPENGAKIGAVGRRALDRRGCAAASLSTARVLLNIGEYFCVRTNGGRYSLLRVEDLSNELKLSFKTWQSSSKGQAYRRVRLGTKVSYHFKTGAKGRYTGGDLYVSIAANGAAMFYANNAGQRGLVDLGDIGRVVLNDVSIPGRGYYKFGVPIVRNHTYVSLARKEERGHHVVFRVDSVSKSDVTLSYVYR